MMLELPGARHNVRRAVRVLMSMKPTRALAAIAVVVVVAGLAACLPRMGPGGAPIERPPLVMPDADPSQEVWALVNVIDDGSGAQLCPIVLESYPPQCGGAIPVDDWTWDGLPLDQEGEVRWGFYAVYGMYDGASLTVTLPAEFGGAIDVMRPPATGPLTADETASILREIQEDLAGDYGSAEGDGVVLLDVVWDDGSLQRQLDERYGEGAVYVSSLFRLYDRA
jgi:hypothetical protein